MYTVHCDVEITRRKSLCHVTNGEGEPIWSGKTAAAAILWLLDQGVYHFLLEADAGACRVMVGRIND